MLSFDNLTKWFHYHSECNRASAILIVFNGLVFKENEFLIEYRFSNSRKTLVDPLYIVEKVLPAYALSIEEAAKFQCYVAWIKTYDRFIRFLPESTRKAFIEYVQSEHNKNFSSIH
ncbi:hypothetical protein D5018_07045 [Parashewanella curva]|uniref:Uncharacterized protein n=1 Tax=Parashewanella curva TaxID=2338552 RepID=A0A3L8PY82_9GAMM|nr:hypothetical protein D5018_07045 [Parashewanella curva]